MGQATREPKYTRVWAQLDDTWERTRLLIERLLLMLTDEQLDELLAELEKSS